MVSGGEMEKLPWPISVGIWFVESKGGDRFTSAYKVGIPIEKRIELVAGIEGVKGVEMHYPYEVDEKNFDKIRKLCKELGLKIVLITPGLFNETMFKDGALSSKNPATRKYAKERIITAMEMNEELNKNGEGGYFTIFWPAADGSTYPFDSYHVEKRKWIREGLIECLQRTKSCPIVIEHKPSDPAAKTYFGTTGEAILLVRDLRRAIDDEKRAGVNPEMAHLLMADTSLGYDISYLLEENMLFHTHWNTCRRRGADTDMLVGSDNWNETAEVFFWLIEYKYDRWLGLDLLPKSEDTKKAIEVNNRAMTVMYNEVKAIHESLKENMRSLNIDITATLNLLLDQRGK